MKILLTSIYYYPKVGGVENSLRYMSKELKRLGHEVAVMSFDNHIKGKTTEEIDGINVFRFHYVANRIPFIRYHNLIKTVQNAIAEVLVDFEADQIWSRNTFVAAGLIKSEKVKTFKHIFSTTTFLNIEGLYSNINDLSLLKKFATFILKKIDFFSSKKIEEEVLTSSKLIPVVFSKMMYRQILEEYDTKVEIHVINPGVDTNVFKYIQSSKDFDEAIKCFPVLNQKYILYVGRIAPAKNLEILIESFAYLKNIKLLIVGEGEFGYVSKIKEFIGKKNLVDNVILIGKQSKLLPVIYSRAILTVLPTKIETFGQILIESLSCGTPVVGFGSNKEFKTAVDEIITNEDNGEIVDRYDSIHLAKAISGLLEKITTNENNIRKNNIEYVKNKYNWEKTVKEILTLFL